MAICCCVATTMLIPSILTLILCILARNIITKTPTDLTISIIRPSSSNIVFSVSIISRYPPENSKPDSEAPRSMEYDYYRESCPQVEQTIRAMVKELNGTHPETIPSLLRLVFHDCFVEGCDASLLLDAIDGIEGEKEATPNESLKGFDIIDLIKAKVEDQCPAVVSCADVLVLAAREAIVLNDGPFYPLLTGRRDSTLSFPEVAEYELPSPRDDLDTVLASFASKGFDKREAVALLDAFYPHEQLKAEEETLDWIKAYTSDTGLFHQDFALAMIKLSNMSVLTAPLGQVRSDCRRVVA